MLLYTVITCTPMHLLLSRKEIMLQVNDGDFCGLFCNRCEVLYDLKVEGICGLKNEAGTIEVDSKRQVDKQ